MFRATLTLLESDKLIGRKIVQACAKYLKVKLHKANKTLANEIKAVLRSSVESQPEYQSLLGGELQAQLGITDPENKLTNIIDLWLNSLKANYRVSIVNNKVTGVFLIEMSKDVYTNLLGSPDAVQDYMSRDHPAGKVPWLEWLLTKGDIILVGYQFRTVPEEVVQRYSRTGMGLMFKNRNKAWTMPGSFSDANINDNFLTRAITQVSGQIDIMVQKKIIEALT